MLKQRATTARCMQRYFGVIQTRCKTRVMRVLAEVATLARVSFMSYGPGLWLCCKNFAAAQSTTNISTVACVDLASMFAYMACGLQPG